MTKNPIQSPGELIAQALSDEKLMDETEKIIKKIFDGEPVNKNPLETIPEPEMRLFYINGQAFRTIDELMEYCQKNSISNKNLIILDYFKELASRKDVIRKQSTTNTQLLVAADEHGYGIYNNERSIYRGTFIWEYYYGNIRELYRMFRDKGIVFEKDIYKEIDERWAHIMELQTKR